MISKRLRRIAGKFQLEFYVITELHDQEANRVSDALMWMLGAGVQRQAEEGVELIQAKSLVEQITTLVQRQVEEEEAPQRSLNRTGAPTATKRTPCSRTACLHDAFAQMPPGVRFHPSDGITGARVPPYHAEIVRGISRGAAMPNTLMVTS